MRSSVGVRELKNQTSAVVRRARHGETITVTDRGVPVALLVPVAGSTVARSASKSPKLGELVAAGWVSWSGGKPRGLPTGPRVSGSSVSDATIEDRR